MKPLATMGDAMQGVTSWRADLRALGVERRAAPSSERAAQPDRGYVAQPGELPQAPERAPALEADVFPPPTQQTLVRLDRARLIEREETAMPAVTKKKRRHADLATKHAAIRRVMVGGESARAVSRDLGLSLNGVSAWVWQWKQEHGNTPPPATDESKTLLSAPTPPVSSRDPASSTSVDQAAKSLVDTLGAYIMAVIDVRVNEAIAERMKRLM